MARGRAFDSDASGSHSRGGHGPGRSARGRGGSIPRPSSGTSGASSSAQRPVLPPSHPSSGTSRPGAPPPAPLHALPPSHPSSGTSRASSSAQRPVLPPSHPSAHSSSSSSSAQRPVLPPSQPSAPSSSAPSSSRPVQTPPAAQSPTVQARQILKIIKLQLHKEGYTWDAVPQEARDFYWEEFQKHFIWDEAITAMLKVAWEKICADRYADFTYRMRKSGKKQQCVSQEIWESWQKAWEDPAQNRKREIFAQNRRSETGGDGAGPSRHTGGSISAIETARLLAKELGREPTPMEVFTYTHTKDHDRNTFVDRRALSVNNYTTARERIVTSQTDESEAESRIDKLSVALYLEAVGGEKKRKVYGIGSQASQFYCGSASHASAPSAQPQPEHTPEEFTELRAHFDDQQRQITELRAHVMRLSSEPGAGTSSSNPTPTTD
ncbi:hypothetical protein JCGZ_20130 [Jatropha curcas]|uniref:Uncharacterized protein n=1 Tax=Jatropha curcas TaxID=180498 RepID=A0A067K6M4_JATCU|nr:hypothetical protein JCGZ_20130 [Jatropha curcas]